VDRLRLVKPAQYFTKRLVLTIGGEMGGNKNVEGGSYQENMSEV